LGADAGAGADVGAGAGAGASGGAGGAGRRRSQVEVRTHARAEAGAGGACALTRLAGTRRGPEARGGRAANAASAVSGRTPVPGARRPSAAA